MTIIIGVICLKTNLTMLPFIGILIGFLLLNWSPAKIFMGDVGSTFLAAICLGLIFETNNFSTTISSLLVFTPILGVYIPHVFFSFIGIIHLEIIFFMLKFTKYH